MRFNVLALLPVGTLAFPSVFESIVAREAESRAQARTEAGCTVSELCNTPVEISDEMIGYDPNNLTPTQKLSAARSNCGALTPCFTFDAEEQLVSVTGQYAYESPAPSQIRGPCPGLNAAANHGYLPRSGVATITETIAGLGAAYGMSVDLAGFLAAYAVIFDGDLTTLAWSIGGPPGTLSLLNGGEGISWSHNKYEGDSSIARCDAYINNGDAHSLSTTRFAEVFKEGMADDRYTLDVVSRAFTKNTFRSEIQNPYYFAPLFSTTLVSPAAYNFVIVFMSNHTAEEPAGYLNGDIFKSFFGVTGEYPNFKWLPGQERIPENWYRRPLSQPYTAHTGVFGDLAFEYLAYPSSFRLGGNTKGVNSFAGVDLGDLTGGLYNTSNLFSADNLACFAYQALQEGVPDVLSSGQSITGAAMDLLLPYLDKAFSSLTCPFVKWNDNNLPPYAGRAYSPTGPATNC